MSEVIEQESTELVTLPAKETALSVYSTAGGLDPLIEQIRAKVAGTVYDMNTAKGRDECRSDAAKVGRSKQAIERMGKDLSAYHKEVPKKIDAERKRAFDELEALQKQVRQPLTEWEEAEDLRVATHRASIDNMRQLAVLNGTEDAGTLKAWLDSIESKVIGPAWDEFETEAARVRQDSVEKLRAALASREKYDAEQIELAKLRAEAEARRIQDEKDRIAKEAAEAATKAAEAKAQAERDAAAKAAADAKAEADRRELQLKLQAETAEREKLEAVRKAEKDQAEAMERERQAEIRAKAEAIAAAERATQAAEAARRAEVKRQADEAARIEAEAKAREANKAHKAKINNAALSAFIAEGLTAECAKLAVMLIATKKIPGITINY